ncbi:hypothetical protein TPHA_0G00240 [Tetrapisispora phaffii CBS 4417]|uniref:Superkiller protein 3 n=1 Tax=Tetrapisispora phaffii (strain ATCC 24235 / CBS 4417 / NBRC 1672 / NRRL Y-8282 / UCD 70-5) TaxID=1071381 RepID=G8BVD4_TETPH|nr:hypothetical protein TPHA_0G00240 [Tetrapisispora phaffii CBS 4417]CCE63862.1 hypothetical protein TPHA_0G00240 [Tetrapisispora phaffii CBS 4417]
MDNKSENLNATKLKQLLKEAKSEVARGDYEEAIDICKQTLKLDKHNYFAYVFLGKSYSCLDSGDISKNIENAISAYREAIDSIPSNLLAWKGLFKLFEERQTMIFPHIIPLEMYFTLCDQYSDLLQEQQQSLVELIHNIRMLRKAVPDIEYMFLQTMRPGVPLAEKIGRHLIKPQDCLKELLSLTLTTEQSEVSKIVSRERLKLSANDPDYQIKINQLAWEVYKNSKCDEYFNQLVNITDNDEERNELEIKWLDHRITVLHSMPADTKHTLYGIIKTMVEDLVLVDTSSVRAWKLYFEWQDYQDLNSLDSKLVLRFFKKFPNEPLAVILYSWLFSFFSKYDTTSFNITDSNDKKVNESRSNDKELADNDFNREELTNEEDIEELKEMLEQDEDSPILLESDILTSLIEYIPKAQTSALAHRIVSQYYILSREYEAALPYIKTGTSLVANSIKSLGATLPNSKLAFTLNLATVYTYFDFKRNYKTALALYEKILTVEPHNASAKLGKGLIFIEMENWKEANNLLLDVRKEFSENMEIVSALGWTYTNLHQYDEAIDILNTALKNMKGTDILSIELHTMTLWRLAKTYLSIQEAKEIENTSKDLSLVNLAYQLLIKSLKLLETFSLSFSTLGHIYTEYYNDEQRAFGCYYKAFELNSGDIIAAEYIIRKYTNAENWSAAHAIAEALVQSDGAKKYLKSLSWPYRVVGISHLERQQEAESIEWFQSALRIDKEDIESWVGLGQAYVGCGRIEASIKVFEKAIELDSNHLYAKLFLAESLSNIGEYEDSILLLKELTLSSLDQEVFHATYASTLTNYATDLYNRGFLTKSIKVSVEAIDSIYHLFVDLQTHPQIAWISLFSSLQLFISVQSKIEELPIETLVSIFETVKNLQIEELDAIDKINLESILSSTDDDNITIACKFLVLSSKCAFTSGTNSETSATVKSSLWHNIGVSELVSLLMLRLPESRDAAIFSFKKAIEYQSNSTKSWIALGISTMDINWRVSQHCFIKSIALSPKDTEVWFNLSLLALKAKDLDFARQVLARTQSIAPQESSPWLGMALLLEKEGNTQESINMFSHAYILANGRSKVAQLLYAKNTLQNQIGYSKTENNLDSLEELSTAAYALEQYLKKSPNDAYALQSSLLVLERLHQYLYADKLASRLSEILEKRFEKTQDEKELYNFAIIKSQISRIQLGLGNYETSIDNANLSQGIIQEYDSSLALSCQISNNICLGLAYYFLDDYDKTLEHFQILTKLSEDSKYLVILVSKVLYDIGSEESKMIALDELTEYIAINGNELLVTLTIAAISLLENHVDILETILQDLQNISLSEKIKDTHLSLQFLILNLVKKLERTSSSSELPLFQQTAFFFPNNDRSWKNLSEKISLRVASEGQNKLTAEQLSEKYSEMSNLRNIQRSLFLTPWSAKSLKSLNECF